MQRETERLTRAAAGLRQFWKRFRETAGQPGTDKAYAGFDSRYPEYSVLDMPTGKRSISMAALMERDAKEQAAAARSELAAMTTRPDGLEKGGEEAHGAKPSTAPPPCQAEA